ncbi:hypothetical protein GOODEAATRI_008492, partial [Goodea atripinnis]
KRRCRLILEQVSHATACQNFCTKREHTRGWVAADVEASPCRRDFAGVTMKLSLNSGE